MRTAGRAALGLTLLLAGCAARPGAADRAWQRGLAFLASQQAADGGFPSRHYGVLRSGCSLTACALYAFALAPAELRGPHAEVIDRGLAFLARHTDPRTGAVGLDRAGVHGIDYPNYTAAFYLLALYALRPADHEALAARQVRYLRRAQLGPDRGWRPEDVEFGGFAFGGEPVPRPDDTELLGISVTSWVLEALLAAGLNADDPTLRRALRFVARCQNDDGGFAFTTAPAHLRSKASDDETPASYGTATADGLCAQRALGADTSRARAWLRAHWSVPRVPGFADGAPLEPALRLYWLAAAARALSGSEASAELRAAVLDRQRPDGAFAGWSEAMKEDDPLVATPLALIALAHLR